MITPEELVDLAEYLKTQKEIPSSSYQLFAAQRVLGRWGQDGGLASLIQLSNALGPIFCRTAEDQRHFQEGYREWLRQRSRRPRDRRASVLEEPPPSPETPTIHWRMKLAALSLLIVPLLTGWFLWQDLRTQQVVGQVLSEDKPVAHASVQLGKGESDEPELKLLKTDGEGRFRLPFQAKDMPLEVTVEAETYLVAKVPVGETIKANRNWLYLNPINLTDTLDIGTIQLAKEQHETPSSEIIPPRGRSQEPPPSELSIQKVAELTVPPPSWSTRLEGWKALGALLPLIIALLWLGHRKWRAPGLKRQASRIPPELKRVQIHTETHHLFPSISLRHLTQRLRQTRFVESAELDVARTIQCTIQRGGLFTPFFGSRREPGYVALIDRTTLADHQAHLAAQLVKDLAKGSVLVRQYEFDEHPTMLQRVDPLRPVRDQEQEKGGEISPLEVMPLADVHAKFPSRRLLCFGDPRLCFDPLRGKLRPWVETLEGWDERYWFSSNTDRLWGQPERILNRRGFHVVPLSHLGLRLLSELLEPHEARRPFSVQQKQRVPGSHERLPERWLERHPPSPERLRALLDDLEAEFQEDKSGRSEERGRQGMRWLAGCAAYPEIHWALTLEWGVRLFGHGPTTETLLPKLTRLVWFRHAFMPDWLRQALYDRLTKDEAECLSWELTDILSAGTADSSEGMALAIATGAPKPEKPIHPQKKSGSLREWWDHLRRKLRLQAMGEEAEPGSPLRDYVMLEYLSGKQGKARGLITRAPKALLKVLFPKGQPWLGFRPFVLPVAAVVATGGLWDWFDPIPVPLPSPTTAIALSSDGRTLAAGLEDGRVVEWEWGGKRIKQTYEFYPSSVSSMVVSPDGTFVAAGYQDGSIHVLEKDVETDIKVLRNHDSPVTKLAFWPSSQEVPQLVSVDQTGNILARELGVITLDDTHRFNRQDVRALAFSADGKWGAGGNREGGVWVTAVNEGEFDAFLYQERSVSFSQEDSNPITNMAWDPTGRWVLGRSTDGMVGVIDREAVQVLASLQGPVEGVSGLSWPREEEAFVTVAGEKGPEVWRLAIPAEVLNAALANIEQERAAAGKAQKEARLREQRAAEKERARLEAEKRAAEKREADLAAKKKPVETQQEIKPTTQADQESAQDPRHNLTQLNQAPSREVMSAVAGKEIPLVFPETNHGLFTFVLLKGLGDGFADINKDGYITSQELYEFAKDESQAEASKRRKSQTPSFLNISGDQGAFLFKNPRPSSDKVKKLLKKDPLSLGKALALIIGIDDYERLPKLDLAVNDARGIGNLLQTSEFTVHLMLNATRESILEKVFDALSGKAESYERVLIYFSGHGNSVEELNSGERRSYLLPVEADPDKIPITGISLSQLLNMARVSSVKHVLFLLDAPVPVEGRKERLTKNTLRSADSKNKDVKAPNATRLVPQQPEPDVSGQTVVPQQEAQEVIPQQQEATQQVEEPPTSNEKLPVRITGKDGAPMVLVPAGEFTMGAREDDKDAQDDERPAHQVYLDAYYIDQFEVTTSRYAAFMEATKRDPPQYWPENVLKVHGQKPVVGVTWDDANAYCEWTGKRLPTEAEWEKVARGTDGHLYPWGEEPPNEKLANFNHCCDFKDYGVLTDVGSFESGKSPYGAYDMAGNVWEWVADWYDNTLYQQRGKAKKPVQNPQGPGKGEFKVLRGGSWFISGRNLRTSLRSGNYPTNGNDYGGFRCAQGAP